MAGERILVVEANDRNRKLVQDRQAAAPSHDPAVVFAAERGGSGERVGVGICATFVTDSSSFLITPAHSRAEVVVGFASDVKHLRILTRTGA
jgi:hypothetical protein